MLAHGCCLAREYGIPAIAVPKATTIIPDGATIEVDGSSGHVRVLEEDPTSVDASVEVTA